MAKLSKAMQGLKQRIACGLRKLWKLSGTIYRGRYHMRLADSPTEVRRLFSYVLGNGRHHGAWKKSSTDPYSTAASFRGWSKGTAITPPCEAATIVSSARSWLAKTGWKLAGRKGPLHVSEVALPR